MFFTAHEVELIFFLWRDFKGINAFSYTAYISPKRQNYRELKLSIKWEGILVL